MGRPERRGRLLLLLGLAALGVASAASAQEETADPKKVTGLLNLAFKFRREGLFDQAAAPHDYVISLPVKPEEKRQAALEGHDVACVQSKQDKAARLAHGVDLAKEAFAM